MSYCSDYVSRKISVLSTIATVAVVIIHSNSLERFRDNRIAFVVGNAIAFLQHWAVPFFFMVSGFFFDRFWEGRSLRLSYFSFLKRKAFSIGLPYVFWGSVFGFFLMMPLKMIVNHQHGLVAWNSTIFDESSWWNVVNQTLGLGAVSNFVGAMWYLRALLLIFLAAPLWVCVRRISRLFMLVMGFALILSFSTITSGGGESIGEVWLGVHLNVASLGWFSLGTTISAFRLEEVKIPRGVIAFSALSWASASGCVIVNRLVQAEWSMMLCVWFRIAPLFLIVGWWGAVDYLPSCAIIKYSKWIGMRFWIYCMHHPVSSWVGGCVYTVVGHELSGRVWLQCLQAPITLLVCYGSAIWVEKRAPRFFALLCGGR